MNFAGLLLTMQVDDGYPNDVSFTVFMLIECVMLFLYEKKLPFFFTLYILAWNDNNNAAETV